MHELTNYQPVVDQISKQYDFIPESAIFEYKLVQYLTVGDYCYSIRSIILEYNKRFLWAAQEYGVGNDYGVSINNDKRLLEEILTIVVNNKNIHNPVTLH